MTIPQVVDGVTDADAAFMNQLVDAANQANAAFNGAGQITTAAITPALEGYGPLANMRAGVANVLDYGADRSGVNNSTNAFLNAIATGKEVYAPYGTYLLTPDLIKIASKRVLFGDGYDTELKQADGTSGTLIQSAATSNASPAIGITIRNLRVNGNRDNQDLESQFGIGLHYTRKAMLDGVYVHDTVRTAIYIAGSKARVVNCEVWDIGLSGGSVVGMAGIVGDHNSSASDAPYDWIVANNRIDGVLEHGIKLYQGCDRSVIHGNVVNDTGWTGIHPWEGDDVVVSSNTIVDTYHDGILVWGDGTTNRGAVVTGNTVVGSETQFGIHVTACDDATVTGNSVRGSLRAGIRVESGDNFVVSQNVAVENGKDAVQGMLGIAVSGTNGIVSGNVAKNNGLAAGGTASVGIRVSVASTTDVIVSHNRCYDDQNTKTQNYGIRVIDGADYVTLSHNNCRGNATAATDISAGGANCTEADTVS
jgi:parallel beta-helix repeat protein